MTTDITPTVETGPLPLLEETDSYKVYDASEIIKAIGLDGEELILEPEDGGDPDTDRARFVQSLYQTVHLAATNPISRELPSPTQVTASAFLLIAELLTDVIDGQVKILHELKRR